MRYSKKTGGFYPASMLPEYEAKGSLPADTIEISAELYAAVVSNRPPHMIVITGSDGLPMLVDPLPVDPQLAIDAKLAHLRAVREEILNRLGGIAGRAARQGDNATADACDIAVQGLLDITKDLPTDLDAIELEVVSRYKVLRNKAALTAPDLVSAFVGMDL